MADEIDRAQEHEEAMLQAAIASQQNAPRMKPTGSCHWCEEQVEGGLLFCDADCRDEYQRRKEIRRKQGLK